VSEPSSFPEPSSPEQSSPEKPNSEQPSTYPEQPPSETDQAPIFPEDHDDDPPEARKPVTAKGVAIASARVITGVIGIGVAAATLAAAAFLPLPSHTAAPASVLVTPVPTAQQLVCPGAVLRLANESGQGATTASAIGHPTVRSFSSTGQIDSSPLGQSDASTGGTSAAPTVISTPPNQADPTQQLVLSGAQVQAVNESEFVGLTAAECGVASGDIWLAGGSTAVGRTTLLMLNNPSAVAATVSVELFGENGKISAPGTSGIIVPASGQRVLSLAGFQPGVLSPVVHVASTGGQIVAELQESIVRGLDAGGIDVVSATTAPSVLNVIPGLSVSHIDQVQALQVGGEDFADLRAVIRLYAPGSGTIATTISVVPEDGAGVGASFAYSLDAGRVVDVPIADLDNGSYTVRVQSASPVLASARVSSALASATDFAWLSAASELDVTAHLTVAFGPSPVLHLNNPATTPATVTLTDNAGLTSTVTVPAGASSVVPVNPGASYGLSGFTTLYAAVTLADDWQLARYAVHPLGVGSAPITVFR
jgi:hypothetical protein